MMAQEEHNRWLGQLEVTRALLNDARATETLANGGKNRGQFRRQLNALKKAIDALHSMVEVQEDESDGVEGGGLSEREKNRRRNIILSLREERDVLLQRLSGAGAVGAGQATTPSGAKGIAQETDETAVRTNAELLQLQRALMEDQDEALDHLERSVGRTKRIALGVCEETELQNRLLEDFDEEVGMTSDEVYNVRQRVKRYLAQRGCCACCGGSGIIALFLVVLILMIVLAVVLKLVF